MEQYRGGSFLTARAVSPLLTALAPNPSILIQYPLFLTMARVTVHRTLSLKDNGRQMSSIQASFRHGKYLWSEYGLFALYRGLPVYMCHSFANTLLSHPVKKMKSNPKIASLARVVVDAATYPLLLVCTRMVAYTTGDAAWSFADCVRDTVQADGVICGLWAGALPFLLVSGYKELEECIFNKVKQWFPKLDDTDTALLGFFRLGLGAVVTSPFLTMSTILRCQSNDLRLMKPTSTLQVFRDMPWKWNLLAISLVLTLGAVNVALISEKHKEDNIEIIHVPARK